MNRRKFLKGLFATGAIVAVSPSLLITTKAYTEQIIDEFAKTGVIDGKHLALNETFVIKSSDWRITNCVIEAGPNFQGGPLIIIDPSARKGIITGNHIHPTRIKPA